MAVVWRSLSVRLPGTTLHQSRRLSAKLFGLRLARQPLKLCQVSNASLACAEEKKHCRIVLVCMAPSICCDHPINPFDVR